MPGFGFGFGFGTGGGESQVPSPGEILADGSLKLWLRSRVGFTVQTPGVDFNINQWDDKSGSGFHAIKATDPTRPDKGETSFNGRPCGVYTRANNDHLRCDAAAAVLQGTNVPFSLGVAIQITTLGVDTNIFRVLRNASSNPIIAFVTNPSNNLIFQRRSDAAVSLTLTTSQTIDGNPHWLWLEFDGANAWLYVDNVVTSINGSAAAVGALTLDRVGIGNNPITPTLALGGKIAELVLPNRVVTGTERTDIWTYAKAELGL